MLLAVVPRLSSGDAATVSGLAGLDQQAVTDRAAERWEAVHSHHRAPQDAGCEDDEERPFLHRDQFARAVTCGPFHGA